MKIIFVVDTADSALATSARQWCSTINGEVYSTNDFLSFRHLITKLLSQAPNLVIFSWRQVLDNAFVSRKNLALLTDLRSQSLIFALVADHSGEVDARFQNDLRLANCGIGIITVTKRLFDIYCELGLVPNGILHDKPNTDLIREVRSLNINRVTDSVIWVGNSQWGSRQGYKDHKGLETKFKPFLSLAAKRGFQVESEVLDSFVERIPQREVFQKIARADLLFVTSHSEGTGLPILEALGLGTSVISTDVGIARDLPTVRLIPVDSSPDDILEAYIEWRKQKVPSDDLISAFENYLIGIEKNWENLLISAKSVPHLSNGMTLDAGDGRKIELIFWNIKFFVKWMRNVKQKRQIKTFL